MGKKNKVELVDVPLTKAPDDQVATWKDIYDILTITDIVSRYNSILVETDAQHRKILDVNQGYSNIWTAVQTIKVTNGNNIFKVLNGSNNGFQFYATSSGVDDTGTLRYLRASDNRYLDIQFNIGSSLINFPGVITSLTAAADTNTTQLATTAFVQRAVNSASTGYASINVSAAVGGVLTVTEAQYKLQWLEFTGTLTENLIIDLPTGIGKTMLIRNSVTQGAYTISLRRIGYTVGSLLPSGASFWFFNGSSGIGYLSALYNTTMYGNSYYSYDIASNDNSYRIANTSFVQSLVALDGKLAGNNVWTGTNTFNAAVKVPTIAGTSDSTTSAASTAFVQAVAALKANINSPTFTGTPAAPTAAKGTNTTQIATTAFVQTGLSDYQPALGFTPVQQGGGVGQLTNKVKIGWSGSRLKATYDTTDLGNIVFDSQLGALKFFYVGLIPALQSYQWFNNYKIEGAQSYVAGCWDVRQYGKNNTVDVGYGASGGYSLCVYSENNTYKAILSFSLFRKNGSSDGSSDGQKLRGTLRLFLYDFVVNSGQTFKQIFSSNTSLGISQTLSCACVVNSSEFYIDFVIAPYEQNTFSDIGSASMALTGKNVKLEDLSSEEVELNLKRKKAYAVLFAEYSDKFMLFIDNNDYIVKLENNKYYKYDIENFKLLDDVSLNYNRNLFIEE